MERAQHCPKTPRMETSPGRKLELIHPTPSLKKLFFTGTTSLAECSFSIAMATKCSRRDAWATQNWR